MDRRRRHILVSAMISGVTSLMLFFGGFLGSYQADSRSVDLLALVVGLGVVAAALTGVAAYMLHTGAPSLRFPHDESHSVHTTVSPGVTPLAVTEPNRWEASLSRLCKGLGLRGGNPDWFDTDTFNASTAISERLHSSIDRLPSEEDRRIALYWFNLIDEFAVENSTFVGRQNALADSGGPSRRAAGHRMKTVIIPQLARMLAA
jgi:hypothetical protein